MKTTSALLAGLFLLFAAPAAADTAASNAPAMRDRDAVAASVGPERDTANGRKASHPPRRLHQARVVKADTLQPARRRELRAPHLARVDRIRDNLAGHPAWLGPATP